MLLGAVLGDDYHRTVTASTPDEPATAKARDDHEALSVLTEIARGGFGSIPSTAIADLVIRMTPGADFTVRMAALDALRRRRAFAVNDGLSVAARPTGAQVLGFYNTQRAASANARNQVDRVRPYCTLLDGIEPLAGSCDCADYARSSLGACKHLLVVMESVFDSSRRLSRARAGHANGTRPSRLSWDPRLPLHGPCDRLAGLRLEESGPIVAGAWRNLFLGDRPDPRELSAIGARRDFAASVHRALSPRGRARPQIDATPAARAVVVEELERAERLARCEAALPDVIAHLASLTRKLYPFQREGVTRFLRSGRILLADDMGLGKTTQAIAGCHALFAAKKVRRGLVIAPSSLKQQWLREWHETTKAPVSVLEGTRVERAQQIASHRVGFLVMSYEQLLRDEEQVRALSPEIVVLDEAQRIKNYATKSAEYVKRLTPEYRLVLTGTPMENRLDELASILDWVDDVALAPKWRLEPLHVIPGRETADARGGVKRLATLRARMAPVVLRRVRSDVVKQLPRRTDTRVPIEMTPQQREEHDALDQPIAKLARKARDRPLRQEEFLRLMQLLLKQRVISNGLGQLHFEGLWPTYAGAKPDAALLDGLFSPKLLELRRLVRDLVVDQGRKIVVFSQWRRMLRLAEWSLRDVLGDAGLTSAFFTGGESSKARTRNLVDFHDDPRVAVMFLSDAGGVGLNLQRAASACINLELPWNPAVLEQRVSRIYRIGQKRPIDVFHLVSEYGIEAHIAGLVSAKQAFFSELFDGTSDELRFEESSSFIGRIGRLLGPALDPEGTDAGASQANRAASEAEADAIETVADTALGLGIADTIPPPPPTLPSSPITSQRIEERDRPGDEGSIALFPGIRVEPTENGGMRIEATPEAAKTLATLLTGLAKLLSRAAPP